MAEEDLILLEAAQARIGFKDRFIKEIKLIVDNFLRDRRTRKALTVFVLWEISFYSALITDVDMKIREFKGLSLSMLIGYLLGVGVLKFFNKKEDEQMIKFGYYLSIISLVPIFIVFPFIKVKTAIIFCYFFYALAAPFLAPSLFSILSKERKPHEQGKIYGLIDSADTISFLVAAVLVLSYNFMQLDQIFLALFSFIIFLVSLIPYAAFRKTTSRNS